MYITNLKELNFQIRLGTIVIWILYLLIVQDGTWFVGRRDPKVSISASRQEIRETER